MSSSSMPRLTACFILSCSSMISAQDSFTVVGLPDTQKYSESFPDVFMAQTAWVVDQRFARDIRYVSHYGDVVEHGDDLEEWEIGNLAMLPLDDVNLPCGVNAGNHDITANGSPNRQLHSTVLPRILRASTLRGTVLVLGVIAVGHEQLPGDPGRRHGFPHAQHRV